MDGGEIVAFWLKSNQNATITSPSTHVPHTPTTPEMRSALERSYDLQFGPPVGQAYLCGSSLDGGSSCDDQPDKRPDGLVEIKFLQMAECLKLLAHCPWTVANSVHGICGHAKTVCIVSIGVHSNHMAI